MGKFRCSICGYIYDETAGIPEKGISPGTKWEDIPEDFVCPLCGAAKTLFEEVKEKEEKEPETRTGTETETVKEAEKEKAKKTEKETATPESVVLEDENYKDLRELSAGELSALCSNLAKGCEKQHLTEESDLFYQLADYYDGQSTGQKGKDFNDLADILKSDLTEGYPGANQAGAEKGDRGALRAVVWSEKVSRMVRSLLDRYAKDGEAMLENTKIYVCDICGFIYVGNDLPATCPVCKVPNFKISQIGRS